MNVFPLIVSSPSGGGKTTLVNELLKRNKNVLRVVTATTRAPRKGERNGKDYHFWDAEQFEKAIKNKQMAEWAKVHTDYYGVPKAGFDSILKKGLIPVLVIDVQGAKTVKKHFKDAVSIFIMPPSWAELKKRLLARNDNTKNIALRLKTAKTEALQIKNYDYVIINAELEKAIADLQSIVTAEMSKVKNNLTLLKKRRLI
ncbi:guanylate kinase [Elusimicrobium posterum]|uniref:guanylate kinase n=1 Tax=Elusimicrobium posterum TaxID=3116653 RepID=UPI003C743167